MCPARSAALPGPASLPAAAIDATSPEPLSGTLPTIVSRVRAGHPGELLPAPAAESGRRAGHDLLVRGHGGHRQAGPAIPPLPGGGAGVAAPGRSGRQLRVLGGRARRT